MSNEKLKTESAVCSNCGGKLDIDNSKDNVVCPYCGTNYSVSELTGESDAVRIEKIKLNAQKEIEKEKLKNENAKNKSQEEKEEIEKFKKSKFSKVLIVFAVIAVLFFFVGNGFLVKFLTFVQAVLFIGAWLMGAKIIKEPIKGIRTICVIIAFILIVPIIGTGAGTAPKESEKIVWEDIVMAEILPEPKSNKGQILSNSDKYLSIYIHKSSKEDYNKYVEACKEKGFTIESENDTSSYDAYNEDGYKLRIYYNEYNKEYNITVDAPMQMSENAWVETPLSKLVPAPNSKLGKVETESAKFYTYYAGETSQEDFSAYANSLINAGFSNDYQKGDDYFYGKNSDGYKVDIRYQGNKIMKISITAPEDDVKEPSNSTSTETTTPPTSTETSTPSTSTETSTPSTSTETSTPSNDSNGVSKDFKEAMDEYEKFFDEYVAFMKKYNESNGTDMSLIADYAKYMNQYAETLKEFEDMKDDEMNEAEAAYYIEVQARINKKLLEIAQ